MFHNVLLLGPGGKTVYQGSVPDAKEYFAKLGFETPANLNPADYYMDVIGGNIKPKEDREDVDLFKSWKSHYSENVRNSVAPESCKLEGTTTSNASHIRKLIYDLFRFSN